jgi:hypothetical protein
MANLLNRSSIVAPPTYAMAWVLKLPIGERDNRVRPGPDASVQLCTSRVDFQGECKISRHDRWIDQRRQNK